MKTALVLLPLLTLACTTPPPPIPLPNTPKTAPKAPSPKPKAQKEPAPDPDIPIDMVTRHIPENIKNAPDDTARVFECMAYNHVTLLNETDKRDIKAVKTRLNELDAAESLCTTLVSDTFRDYPTFVVAFDREWRFYEAYFRLTLEAFAVQNRLDFCQQYKLTVEASQDALSALRTYAAWLSRKRGTGQADPTIETLRQRAREKVSGFGVIVSRLGPQYQRECKP